MTKTTFLIDKKIKNTALKKAKKDGIPLSSVIRILLQEYSNGKISITANFSKGEERDENGFTKREVREILEAKKDADEGNSSFSGPFETIEEIENHLNNLD